jgi:hypothetical protein
MPISWTDPRIGVLFRCVGDVQDGLTAREIAARLSPRLPHRTLQRLLAGLVVAGFLRSSGAARSTRYCLWKSTRQGGEDASVRIAPTAPAAPTAPVRVVANPPRPVPQPAPNRVILPAVPPPPPACASVPPVLRAKYKGYLDQLVPLIVQTGMSRRDALSYARNAADTLGRDDKEFVAVIESELDTLNPEIAGVYGIDIAAWMAWRRRWTRT